MAEQSGEFQITVRMTPEQGAEFLGLLAEDDEFRKRFGSDTQALLAEWGIEISGEVLAEPVVVPSKGMMQEARELLEQGEEFAVPQPFRPPFTFWLVFLAASRASRR